MPRPLSRTGLATRIALLALGIVVVTGIVAGVVATGLIRSSGNTAARQNLARLADVVQQVAGDSGAPSGPAARARRAARTRVRNALIGLRVSAGGINNGTLTTKSALVMNAVDSTDVDAVVNGTSVDRLGSVNGTTVIVEGRPTSTGGVFLVQRRADATAQTAQALRRFLYALLIAGAIALVLGLVVAYGMSRSLKRAAAAAHALALGRRDIVLGTAGPTEVAEVSAAVNTLTSALTQSEARQREFLLSVSHDLRTPLTAIAGYGESLADGVVPAEEVPRVSAVVLAEARRLDRLVGDLLDLARLDAQDLRVEFAAADLAALARSAAIVWADRCAAEGVVFSLDAPPGPLVCTTDPARVRQALDGLFDNALRVTPPGRPIVLAVRGEPGTVVAEVRDGGPGLTDADLPVAFARGALHERYRGVREVGTGLGLAIVHRLVARLGGTVEAGHAAEGGARFTLRLPAG